MKRNKGLNRLRPAKALQSCAQLPRAATGFVGEPESVTRLVTMQFLLAPVSLFATTMPI